MSIRLFAICFCMFLLALFLAPPKAVADEWDQETRLTFKHAFEVPGKTLPAGKYTFTLMNDDSDRNIGQIWNADRTKLFATILAIPDYRLKSADHPVLTFEERPASQPEALKAWFYPGDLYGHEFVYPKSRATELAKRTGQPVLSMPNEVASALTPPAKSVKEPAVTALKQAPIKTVLPSGQETVAKAAQPREQAMASQPKRLPQTTSSLPLLIVLGFGFLEAAFIIRRFAGRIA